MTDELTSPLAGIPADAAERPIPSDDDEATIPDFVPEAPDVTPG